MTTPEILHSVYLHTLDVRKQFETILAVEDTTDLSFSRTVKKEGPKSKTAVRAQEVKRKLYQHTSIALDAKQGDVFGLLHQHSWERHEKKTGGSDTASVKQRRKTPYHEKESFKWEAASRSIDALFGEQSSKLISVCDREADVLEYLAYKRKKNQRFVVRATQNRRLAQKGYLFDALDELLCVGVNKTMIPRSGTRKARTAELTLSAGNLHLSRGKNYKKRGHWSGCVQCVQRGEPNCLGSNYPSDCIGCVTCDGYWSTDLRTPPSNNLDPNKPHISSRFCFCVCYLWGLGKIFLLTISFPLLSLSLRTYPVR